jgi:hypothetical protein
VHEGRTDTDLVWSLRFSRAFFKEDELLFCRIHHAAIQSGIPKGAVDADSLKGRAKLPCARGARSLHQAVIFVQTSSLSFGAE